jgi:hypothetical protein
MPHFTAGGIWGDIKGAASSVLGGAKSVAEALADPVKWITSQIAKPLSALSIFDTTDFGKIIAAVPKGIADKLLDSIKSAIGLGGGGSAGSPTAPANVTGAVALGKAMAASRGWTGVQWNDLYSLWQAESGWRYNAANPSSPAYGIPQADPGDKMATAGADWRTNPATQIKWGLDYIASAYGSPARAWLQEETNYKHFPYQGHVGPPYGYDDGGTLDPGYTLAYNGTRATEVVAPRQTFEQIMSGASGGTAVLDRLIAIEGHLASAPQKTGEAVADGVADEFKSAAVAHAKETAIQNRRRPR